MRIICPEHNGIIEVPDQEIADALNSLAKFLLFRCPVCQSDVLIKDEHAENSTQSVAKAEGDHQPKN